MEQKTGYTIVTPDLLDLLEVLYRYKYMRTSFLRDLLGAGYWGMIEQLQLRTKQGFIKKPKAQYRAYNNMYCPRIHGLTKKGENLLIERGRIPPKAARLVDFKVGDTGTNFAHSMMIVDVKASFEIGFRETGCTLRNYQEILARTDKYKPYKLEFDTVYKGVRFKGKLEPDDIFEVEYPDGTVSHYFLEAERFNPVGLKALTNEASLRRAAGRSSFIKKLLGYRDIAKKGAASHLGFNSFKVLFVAPNQTKVQNMVEVTEAIFGKTGKALFHAVPVQEDLLKAPPPFPELVTSKWKRAGMEAVPLYDPQKAQGTKVLEAVTQLPT